MGADNLALWKAMGVTGGKKEELCTSFPNPARPDAKVFTIPDSVHAMKAIKNMLESNRTLTLPQDVVEAEGLSSATVDYKHIVDLLEYEDGYELKVAFRLKKDTINCKKQFKSMNVGSTKSVICQRTGVGLKLLGEEKQVSSYDTTAWFVIFLNAFFALATGRSKALGISKHNRTAYFKAIRMIKTMSHIFCNMSVGKKGEWKPVQRGIKVLCNSYLGLTDLFLEHRKYSFLMLGRFTSDCIENVFSLIRLRQSVSDASQFLQCPKIITLSKLSEVVSGSSYDYEESTAVGPDFLEEARRRAKERAAARKEMALEELLKTPIRRVTEEDKRILSKWELLVIYDMAGSTVAAIKRSNMKVCETCMNAVMHLETEQHSSSYVSQLKEFTLLRSDTSRETLQIYVSDEVFKAFVTVEVTYRLFKERTLSFKAADVKEFFVKNLMYVWSTCSIPDCHQLPKKLLTVFLDYRLANTIVKVSKRTT